MSTKSQSTAVIGGGMAGCAAARELLLAGHEVTVFETDSEVGGRAHSWHRPEISPDTGVNLWFTSFYRELLARVKEYGLEDQLEPMENSVIIVADGKHAELRATSLGTLLRYPFIGLSDRLRFLRSTLAQTLRRRRMNPFEPAQLARYDDQSASEWATSAMSPAVYQYLIRPTVESFWLWRCEEVSAAHVRAMQAYAAGASFYVLRGGMEEVAKRMVADAQVCPDTEVAEVAAGSDGGVSLTVRHAGATRTEAFDNVVVATTGSVAAKITASLPVDLVPAPTRQFCESQRYEPVVSLSYLVDRGVLPSDFHIVPGGPGVRDVRGMIAWPRTEQTPEGPRERDIVFVYLGRESTAELLGASDEERFARGLELAPTLWPDFPSDAKPFHIVARREGLPWPEPGRYRAAARIAQTQRGPVVFAGDYLGGPTAEAAMRTGIRAARALTGAAP